MSCAFGKSRLYKLWLKKKLPAGRKTFPASCRRKKPSLRVLYLHVNIKNPQKSIHKINCILKAIRLGEGLNYLKINSF